MQKYDVIIIGGSYSGMSAGLQLLRARKEVLVIDAGQRRNRFAHESHGFLGQDGVDPAKLAHDAREQLMAYHTLSWVHGEVVSLEGDHDNFSVSVQDGQVHKGRRILFATGVTDLVPEISGLEERWGKSIFHCPYCHGYELSEGRIGVIGTGPNSTHQAELLTEWGSVTFFLNDALELDEETRRTLESKCVAIEQTPIVALEGNADVRLADGRCLSLSGIFVATSVSPASDLPVQMGCDVEETMVGKTLRTNGSKETNIRGVFACGDVAHLPHSVALAVGDGAIAGAHLHRSLVWPNHEQEKIMTQLKTNPGNTNRYAQKVS